MENQVDWQEIPENTFEEYLSRLALIETLIDDGIDELTKREIRQDFCRMHNLSERTVRSYLKRYRDDGPQSLLFYRKKTEVPRLKDEQLSKKILQLLEEIPTRTVPRLRKLISGIEELEPKIAIVSDRTIYRFLMENDLSQKQRYRKLNENGRERYHKFQADYSLQLVQGDARDGIWLKCPDGETRKTYLFGWVDDYSRKILSAKYYFDEKLPRMEDSFKDMILRWGIPEKVYLDNGSVYIAHQFASTLADLGIKKIHHKPYQAYCKGKIEAVMKTLKREFQEEAQNAGMTSLDELNSALQAWLEMDYNIRNHSSTGEAPSKRFSDGLPVSHKRITDLKWFYNLFLCRETRTITKYGRIKLSRNEYAVKSLPFGTVAEIRYDPFDLNKVYLFKDHKLMETLLPAKLNCTTAKNIPEESSKTSKEISQDSALYMKRLREKHMESKKSESMPKYSEL
jgi:putative transposase